MNQIEKYAAIGLRTLLLAKKTISEEEYEEWAARRTEAECSLENREKMIDNVNERIEKGMKLVGATAIEDKLQDEV
jgi:magnesium-transporting ATPase (P-type)